MKSYSKTCAAPYRGSNALPPDCDSCVRNFDNANFRGTIVSRQERIESNSQLKLLPLL